MTKREYRNLVSVVKTTAERYATEVEERTFGLAEFEAMEAAILARDTARDEMAFTSAGRRIVRAVEA